MVELAALTQARATRLACQASSRRAGWEFRRACAGAASIGEWIDGGENVLRLGSQWGGLGMAAASLFYPGKKVAGHGVGLGRKLLAGVRLCRQFSQLWSRRQG